MMPYSVRMTLWVGFIGFVIALGRYLNTRSRRN